MSYMLMRNILIIWAHCYYHVLMMGIMMGHLARAGAGAQIKRARGALCTHARDGMGDNQDSLLSMCLFELFRQIFQGGSGVSRATQGRSQPPPPESVLRLDHPPLRLRPWRVTDCPGTWRGDVFLIKPNCDNGPEEGPQDFGDEGHPGVPYEHQQTNPAVDHENRGHRSSTDRPPLGAPPDVEDPHDVREEDSQEAGECHEVPLELKVKKKP